MKYNPKYQLKVGGKMSEQGADKAGNKLANAAIIAALGIMFIGLSFVLKLFL